VVVPPIVPPVENVPIPDLVVARDLDVYKEVTLFVKERPEWWRQSCYYFTVEIIICLIGLWAWYDAPKFVGLFIVVGGCIAVQPIKQVIVLLMRADFFTFKGVAANVFPFSLMFHESTRTNPRNFKRSLGQNAVLVSVNQKMLNDLHKDGRMCDYSKGDVFARCSSILAKAHEKRPYTNSVGEPLTEEEITNVSSNVIAYFLQSLVIARTHADRGAVTRDSFKELLSN
jgi:hypothetical protein